MTKETGNMWSAHPSNGGNADLFCITTNSFIRNDGSLVMGAGIARQARDRMPGLSQNAGQKITETCGHLGEYGLLLPDTSSPLAFFQVKTHWNNSADTQLIAGSAADLSRHLQDHGPDYEVHLNFPGIGNGGLSKGDVLPIISPWPSNVHIWTYE